MVLGHGYKYVENYKKGCNHTRNLYQEKYWICGDLGFFVGKSKKNRVNYYDNILTSLVWGKTSI